MSGFYYVLESEHTGIYLSDRVDMTQGYYNLTIETVNPKVLLYGMKVGDTQQTAFAKLKTAGYVDMGQNSEGYEVFVHDVKPQLIFVAVVGGKVDMYQYDAIDPNMVVPESILSAVPARQYKAFAR